MEKEPSKRKALLVDFDEGKMLNMAIFGAIVNFLYRRLTDAFLADIILCEKGVVGAIKRGPGQHSGSNSWPRLK